jgi:hypothetical protein
MNKTKFFTTKKDFYFEKNEKTQKSWIIFCLLPNQLGGFSVFFVPFKTIERLTIHVFS